MYTTGLGICKLTFTIIEHGFDILHNPPRRFFYKLSEILGTCQKVLDDVRKAAILQNHFHYQFRSFPGQYLNCGFVELQDLLVHRYECCKTLEGFKTNSLQITNYLVNIFPIRFLAECVTIINVGNLI